jgi:hypothetical protein
MHTRAHKGTFGAQKRIIDLIVTTGVTAKGELGLETISLSSRARRVEIIADADRRPAFPAACPYRDAVCHECLNRRWPVRVRFETSFVLMLRLLRGLDCAPPVSNTDF